jgi:hypothetical protein
VILHLWIQVICYARAGFLDQRTRIPEPRGIHFGDHQINSQTEIASFLKISAAGNESGIKRNAIEQDAAKNLVRYGVHWMVESGGDGMVTLET